MAKSTKKTSKKPTRPAARAGAKKVSRAAKRSTPSKSASKGSAKSSSRKATTRKTATKSTSRAKATTASASKGKTSRAGAASRGKNGTPVLAKGSKSAKATRKSTGTTKKTSKSKSGGRKGASRNGQIDVKVGSFGGPKPGSFGFGGGGASFLSGRPGSTGGSDSDDRQPRLTKTKLTARELRHFRELLLTKRRQLLGDMETMENEALRSETSNLSHLPVHMADMGTDNYEQEFTLSLVDRDRQMVDEIDAALRRIDDKTYGICEGTGQMISKERLEAQPWARYSIEHARRLQRPGIRR